MRIELLPRDLKEQALAKINDFISRYNLVQDTNVILNRRRDDLVVPVITQIIFEYKHLLDQDITPTNVEEDRYNLVKFLKSFEGLRNNCILNYLPEYEEFLRSYGY